MGLPKTEKLLHSKIKNKQNENLMNRMGENIFKLYIIDKGLIFKTYKELIELSSKKKKQKQTQIKIGNGPESTFFFPENTYNQPTSMWKGV